GPGGRVAGEQQVEHRHEVRLARAEAAVQVGGLRAAGLDGAGDEPERVVERRGDLRRDLVAVDGGLRLLVGDALGQLEDEVAVADLGGDVDELTDEGHGVLAGGDDGRRPTGARPQDRARRTSRSSLSRRSHPPTGLTLGRKLMRIRLYMG